MTSSKPPKPRAMVYIDGFNLYYSALKGTPSKWLDLQRMCRQLFPELDIQKIYYCTAPVSARPDNPQIHIRQQLYLRALRTIPCVEIVEGQFKQRRKYLPLHPITQNPPQKVDVVVTEEKGSDVNVASLLLCDGYEQKYDVAVVISNDTDLSLPIKSVRDRIGKPIYVVTPLPKPHHDLCQACSGTRQIRSRLLAASQFPNQMVDQVGTFTKPPGW